MSTPVELGTATVRLAHRVRLRHTADGLPLAVTAAIDHLPAGWTMRVRGADVVLAVRDGAPAPAAAPVVTLTSVDARPVAGPEVTVPLTGADLVIDVDPVPMTLTVLLTAPDGSPATGRTLTVRSPSTATTVPVPEVGGGTYRTAPRTWTADLVPFDLLVDGTPLRQLALDLTRAATTVRLVDTT